MMSILGQEETISFLDDLFNEWFGKGEERDVKGTMVEQPHSAPPSDYNYMEQMPDLIPV